MDPMRVKKNKAVHLPHLLGQHERYSYTNRAGLFLLLGVSRSGQSRNLVL